MTSSDTSTDLVQRHDGHLGPVIRLVGEVDTASAPGFAAACDSLEPCHLAGHVVVDLSEVTFFDSTALAVLAGLAKASEQHGGTVVLSRPPRLVRRLLDITCMAEAFVLVEGGPPPRPDDTR